jgi:hypothetical protein
LQLIVAGLQSGQWNLKKASAAATADICKSGAGALAEQAPSLLDALLKASTPRRSLPPLWPCRPSMPGLVGLC